MSSRYKAPAVHLKEQYYSYRSFLLDRLLKYETTESTTDTEGSDSSEEEQQTGGKKRKLEATTQPKKKKMMLKKQQNVMNISNQIDEVAMVERHLEARNSISMPSFTFPQEIFDD